MIPGPRREKLHWHLLHVKMPLTNLDLFRLGAFEACVQFLTGAQLADMEEKKEGESKLEGLANILK